MNKPLPSSRPANPDPQRHVIRLRGNWACAAASGGADFGEVQLPAGSEALFAAAPSATLRLQRRFGCPTGLGPEERVELVIDAITSRGSLRLNEHSLGELAGWPNQTRVNIKPHLQIRNLLVIDLDPPPPQTAAFTFDVRLEIVSS